MIEKKTVVDQITVTRFGHVHLRFGLLVVEDGVEIGHQWHRTAVEPGGDVDAQIALVNEHLTRMGFKVVDAADIAMTKAVVKAAGLTGQQRGPSLPE